MLIDLNGMFFHLNIKSPSDTDGFRAEIVDEAFAFDVQRQDVRDLDGVAAFVQLYSGIKPRTDVLSQIARRLEDLHRSGADLPEDRHLPREEDRIAAAG